MERISISLEDELLGAFDGFCARRGYGNRSEALRDLIRAALGAEQLEVDAGGACVASLTYVYDHRQRLQATRLVEVQHRRHDLNMATLHLHIDHDTCLETTILKGAITAVRAFAGQVTAQPGVRHGHLHLVPVDRWAGAHSHGEPDRGEPGHGPGGGPSTVHEHLSPKT